MGYEFRGPGVAKPPPKGRKKEPAPPEPYRPAPEPAEQPWGAERSGSSGRSLLQIFAAVFGLVFLLVGVAGFIPGITDNTDQLETYGTDSNAELLGLFQVSILHNAVHILFGVGLLAALRAASAKVYLLVGGVANLGVAAYGFVVEQSSDANFLPFNDNDNYLHVGLSAAMILFGLLGVAVERRR